MTDMKQLNFELNTLADDLLDKIDDALQATDADVESADVRRLICNWFGEETYDAYVENYPSE